MSFFSKAKYVELGLVASLPPKENGKQGIEPKTQEPCGRSEPMPQIAPCKLLPVLLVQGWARAQLSMNCLQNKANSIYQSNCTLKTMGKR